jgi:ATP-dependent helicase/nuclease subunit A
LVTSNPRLPFDEEEGREERASRVERPPADYDARAYAIDPLNNVVLEASAGTGKTRVLVERYVNLLRAGVDPDHILAITFTRKAAAEMRQRIVERLKEASRVSQIDAARWRDLRSRLGDIAISTIDAFCLRLLREFPLEADVDPGFELADDTEVLRLIEESLDGSLRTCRALAKEDEDVALVFAQLGERRLRQGLTGLLGRRLVAPDLLRRFLADGPRNLTAAVACRSAKARLCDVFDHVPGGIESFLKCGPLVHPQFAMLAVDIAALCNRSPVAQAFRPAVDAELKPGATPTDGDFAMRSEQAAFRAFVDRLRGYFLTQEGKPRGERFSGTPFRATHCASEIAWKRHRDVAASIAPAVAEIIFAFRRDLNVVLARGVWRMFAVTLSHYRRALDARALLDFSGVLERAVNLLQQMDEFARSRFRLESRYHHVLVDEFQDTSRAQWNLVAHLVRSWGEGSGVSAEHLPPSIFVVGDRKQSIYGFRDAEAELLEEAAGFITTLRAEKDIRRAIAVSFRSVPALLAFVNDVFTSISTGVNSPSDERRGFRYGEIDRFPLSDADQQPAAIQSLESDPALGLVVGETVHDAAEAVGDEIVRLLADATVRDKTTGIVRQVKPADVAILFRSRESHREFEAALERRAVQTYVYKGLGFFEADEIQDAVTLLRYLADPTSGLRAAAFLRSRLVRLSDEAIRRLAPEISAAIVDGSDGSAEVTVSPEDRVVLDRVRTSVARWLTWVDRMPPSELLDAVLSETAYYIEIRGARRLQARENLKKLRALIRRIQNHGYATLARIADHLERLAVGDESNATIDAIDAVNLMTVHAAKGLEFPIVFVVNTTRGTSSQRAPVRVATSNDGTPAIAVADFQSEADEETQAREREETKRLLYVALTRARERLYLSATVQKGVCRPGRGSLGDVMPRSLVDLFVNVAGSSERLVWWTPLDGSRHVLLALRHDPSVAPSVLARPGTLPSSIDDFAPIS